MHRTETVTTMGNEQLVAVSSIRSDQKQQSFFIHISFCNEVGLLQGCDALQSEVTLMYGCRHGGPILQLPRPAQG